MKAMRVLRKFLIMCGLVAGLSFAVSAQKPDDKKPQPKPNPPVINPAPPKNPPPDSNKPKKPGMAVVRFKSPDLLDLA
jgi:hypothetical protein